MITKEELNANIASLTEKFNYIAESLEHLYQQMIHSDNAEVRNFASRIENIQFDGYANPSQLANTYRFNALIEIVEENERAKNLDKFLEYENTLRRIKEITKEIE